MEREGNCDFGINPSRIKDQKKMKSCTSLIELGNWNCQSTIRISTVVILI